MRLAPLAAFALSLALPATSHALDLTPQFADLDADGLRMRTPFFHDGAKRVFIKPPNGWKIEGSSQRAVLFSDRTPHSSIALMLSPKPMLPTTEAERKIIRDTVLALAGKDAEKVILEAETPDPLPLNGWKTFDFRIAFTTSGVRQLKSVMLVRLNAFEELQVVVSGPQNEFGQASSAAMTCLRTWHKQ